jgi:hypothetical protein
LGRRLLVASLINMIARSKMKKTRKKMMMALKNQIKI